MRKVKYLHSNELHNKSAASIILPLVFELVKPKSVIDVGCGTGSWLSVCRDLGIEDIIGVDGIELSSDKLEVPKEKIRKVDLRSNLSPERQFDIAICLEVIEHLPQSSEENLLDYLSKSSDTILFSGALPGQGGQFHINEKWPEYWVEKFRLRGYNLYDIIRPEIWDNENIEWWYRQNILLFSKSQIGSEFSSFYGRNLVHPVLLHQAILRETQIEAFARSGRMGFRFAIAVLVNTILAKLKF